MWAVECHAALRRSVLVRSWMGSLCLFGFESSPLGPASINRSIVPTFVPRVVKSQCTVVTSGSRGDPVSGICSKNLVAIASRASRLA